MIMSSAVKIYFKKLKEIPATQHRIARPPAPPEASMSPSYRGQVRFQKRAIRRAAWPSRSLAEYQGRCLRIASSQRRPIEQTAARYSEYLQRRYQYRYRERQNGYRLLDSGRR